MIIFTMLKVVKTADHKTVANFNCGFNFPASLVSFIQKGYFEKIKIKNVALIKLIIVSTFWQYSKIYFLIIEINVFVLN
jgi:hypothetical protein